MTRSDRTRNRSHRRGSPPSYDFREPAKQGDFYRPSDNGSMSGGSSWRPEDEPSRRPTRTLSSRSYETLGTGSNAEPFGINAAVERTARRRHQAENQSSSGPSRTAESMISPLTLGSARTPVPSLLPSVQLTGDPGNFNVAPSAAETRAQDPMGRNRWDDVSSDVPRGRRNSMDRIDASPSPRSRHHRSRSRKNVGYRTHQRTSRASSLRPTSMSGKSGISKSRSVSTLRPVSERGSQTAGSSRWLEGIVRDTGNDRAAEMVSELVSALPPPAKGSYRPCLWCSANAIDWVPLPRENFKFEGITSVSSFRVEVFYQDRRGSGTAAQSVKGDITDVRACSDHKTRLDTVLLYAVNNPEAGSKIVLTGRTLHISTVKFEGDPGE